MPDTHKVINIRTRQAIADLATWTEKNPVLLKGELAAEIVNVTGTTENSNPVPEILFKIGDGTHTYTELNYVQAKAADVYAWAKQNGIVINTTGSGDFITGVTWDAANMRINVTKGSYIVTTSGTGAVITGISKSGTTITATKGNISYNDLTNKPTINNDNQTVKGNGTAFGSNAAIDIVPGSNVTITPDTANNKITISSSYTDTNQKVKAGTTTFGNNDTVEIKAGTNVTVTPDATAKTITIASTDTNTTYAFAEGSTNGAFQVTPSGGSAQSVKVHGLGSAAYTNSGDYATSAQGTKADNAMPKSGGTFTGDITLKGDPTADLHAATKQYVDSKTAALTSAMHFIGTKSSIPSSGTFNDGDVILVGTKEYVYDSSNGSTITTHWVELGDEGSHALKTITVSAGGGLTGGGDLSANRTISHANKNASLTDVTAANGKVISAVSFDSYGHPTSVSTSTLSASDGIKLDTNNTFKHTNSVTAKTTDSLLKIKYDAQGHITGSSAVAASDIPDLPASKITSGTIADARIASAATWNAKQDALTFDGTYNSSTNKAATVSTVTNKINALDSSVAATAAADNQYSVLTGVTQTDGKLTGKTEVKLSAIAKTGNVNDLIQTAGDYIILNCNAALGLE